MAYNMMYDLLKRLELTLNENDLERAKKVVQEELEKLHRDGRALADLILAVGEACPEPSKT